MSAEDDVKAKKLVLDVLRSKPISALDFTLEGRKVSPSMYEDVAKAIESKKITILIDKVSGDGDGAGAAYFFELKRGEKTIMYDLLALRFSEHRRAAMRSASSSWRTSSTSRRMRPSTS
jgi:hypothetical protein